MGDSGLRTSDLFLVIAAVIEGLQPSAAHRVSGLRIEPLPPDAPEMDGGRTGGPAGFSRETCHNPNASATTSTNIAAAAHFRSQRRGSNTSST